MPDSMGPRCGILPIHVNTIHGELPLGVQGVMVVLAKWEGGVTRGNTAPQMADGKVAGVNVWTFLGGGMP